MAARVLRPPARAVTIRVRGAQAELHGVDAEAVLGALLTFDDPKRHYHEAYRRGDWDGQVRLYSGRTFPAGFVGRVTEHLNGRGYVVGIHDTEEQRKLDLSCLTPGYLTHPTKPDFALREHQLGAIRAALQNRRGVIKSPTGSGKCLAPETEVLYFDGSVKCADQVRVGDLLMGPDSQPRRVCSTTEGVGPRFEIVPGKGEPWICNDAHVLTLVHTTTDAVIDIAVSDYVRSTTTFKHEHKLFVVGVDWPSARRLLVDPYFVGLWLGDGAHHLRGIIVHGPEEKIGASVRGMAAAYGLRVVNYEKRAACPALAISSCRRRGANGLLEDMRGLFPDGSCERIPREYLLASREDRLELLAGFLDADGHLGHGYFDVVLKDTPLVDDLMFLARSLGFRVCRSERCVDGTRYPRFSILGDVSVIPTRIAYKRASARRQVKDALRVGFDVRLIGAGPYVGWTLDGDGRFLLGDFTVTHNTEDMAVIARVLWEQFEYRTLIVAPKRGIAKQTADRLRMYYGDDLLVGLLSDGHREVGHVTVATGQTLMGYRARMRRGSRGKPGRSLPPDPMLREVIHDFEVLMFDECHRTASDSWWEIAQYSEAKRRYGFSGTPLSDDDVRDAKLIGATGPVLFEAGAQTLIEHGYAARPKIVMVMSSNASGADLPKETRTVRNPRSGVEIVKPMPVPYQDAYLRGVVQNDVHNRAVCRAVSWLVDHKRQTIVLCRLKEHFRTLAEMFENVGLSFAAVWGDTDSSDRDHVKRAFAERRINVVLATTIWDEGEDVASVEGIVLAEGVRVSTNSRQRVGRGMRPDSAEVWVVDFVPTCHPKLIEHAHKRALAYEGEGYEVCVLEEWPAPDEETPEDLLPFLTWGSV